MGIGRISRTLGLVGSGMMAAILCVGCFGDAGSGEAKVRSGKGKPEDSSQVKQSDTGMEQHIMADQPYGPPQPRILVKGPLVTVPAADRIAYLTFDDGPSNHTEQLLEILREYGAKATFFVVGQESERAKELYRLMVQDGHKIGNHTYSHDYTKLYRNPEVFMQDVRKLDQLIEETTGQRPDVIRFPGGSNTRLGRRKGQAWLMPQLVKRVQAEGYQYFDWNVSSTDAAQRVQPKKDIIGAVLSSAKGKNRIIVLMHDVNVKTTTLEALPEVLEGLRRMGFRFAVLEKDSFTTHFLE